MTGSLLYDPDCGFCSAAANRMQGWGLRTTIEPLSPAWRADRRVDAARALREVPFVDDRGTWYGARAIGRALATGPLPLRLAGLAIAHRPVWWLADPVYRWVAAHRHQLPGGTTACRMSPAGAAGSAPKR